MENIKQKFFEAQEWLKDPNGDHTTMTIPDVESEDRQIAMTRFMPANLWQKNSTRSVATTASGKPSS